MAKTIAAAPAPVPVGGTGVAERTGAALRAGAFLGDRVLFVIETAYGLALEGFEASERTTLAGDAPVRRPSRLPFAADRHPARRTRLPRAPVDPEARAAERGPRTPDPRAQVRSHLLARGREQTREVGVRQRRDRGERIDPGGEQRLGLVDVPDAGDRGLVEDRFADGPVAESTQPADRLGLVEGRREDVGTEGREPRVPRELVSGDELDDGRLEADRRERVRLQHGTREVRRLPPALAGPVEAPRARHPHVRLERVAALE